MQFINVILLSLSTMLFPLREVKTTAPINKGDLTVSIKNFKNTKGQIGILIFNQETGFPSQQDKAMKDILLPITGKTMEHTFKDLPYGKYAVTVMHDENKNRVLDKNLFGIPKEGYGTSNNVIPKMAPPKFGKAAFQFQKNGQSIQINLRY
ncbi:MAG: DUF2141 domain-containing protein [Bacteroidota bacterium]